MSQNPSLHEFLKISQQRMHNHYLPKLLYCIDQLEPHMLWNKPTSTTNSIGGITLHIVEHVNRNSIRFAQQDHPGFTTGIEDHFPDTNLSPEELKEQVHNAFDTFYSVMNTLITRHSDDIDMHSLYHLVEHTGYHLGQIVDRTKIAVNQLLNFCQDGINEKNLRTLIGKRSNM
ncbi:hypothetical protein [Paenibacillus wulumuqiensis]|uniref:hypothetical protein n=1 Tax=Paenibacillus wulumuqiensis TaxID=1567107 RepID=UPI000619D2FF|nr:hypothetical protein [Paenibacillus wulumuqiensis]